MSVKGVESFETNLPPRVGVTLRSRKMGPNSLCEEDGIGLLQQEIQRHKYMW